MENELGWVSGMISRSLARVFKVVYKVVDSIRFSFVVL